MHIAQDTKYLTPEDLARRWGLAEGTIRNMRHYGKGPAFIKLNGKSIRYPLAEVVAYERSQALPTGRNR